MLAVSMLRPGPIPEDSEKHANSHAVVISGQILTQGVKGQVNQH